MELVKNSIEQNAAYLPLVFEADASYSDVIKRDSWRRTAIHCPDKAVTVQITLVKDPDLNSDDDWITVNDSPAKYVNIDGLAYWIRCKASFKKGDRLYIQSAYSNYM